MYPARAGEAQRVISISRSGSRRSMAGLNDSQDDSQHGRRLAIVAVGSGILTSGFELWRTSMDGGGRQARGLQNR